MKDVLKELGLLDNEITIYLTLLKLGSSSVNTIAEKTGLYRPYVYDNLNRLIEKGMVSFVLKDNRKHFQAERPQKLMEQLKEKEERLKNIMPDLIGLTKFPKEETNVHLFKGKQSVRIILKDVMKTLEEEGGENLVIGVDEHLFHDADPIIMKQFFHFMDANKYKEKVLIQEGNDFLPGGKNTEYRFMPKQYFNPTTTNIYGNKVAITVFGTPPYALIIESKEVADSYRKQFHMLWKLAKKK